MTEPEKCKSCGQPKTTGTAAGTMTQWISNCGCEIEGDEWFARTVRICAQCNKRIKPNREGSLTQWVFQTAFCDCQRPKLREKEANNIKLKQSDSEQPQTAKKKSPANKGAISIARKQSEDEEDYGSYSLHTFTPGVLPDDMAAKKGLPLNRNIAFVVLFLLLTSSLIVGFLSFNNEPTRQAKVEIEPTLGAVELFEAHSVTNDMFEREPAITNEILVLASKRNGEILTVHLAPEKIVDFSMHDEPQPGWRAYLQEGPEPTVNYDLSQVKFVNLSQDTHANETIQYITKIPCEKIDLSRSDINDNTVFALTNMKSLKAVSIEGNEKVTIAGASNLTQLPALSALKLDRLSLRKSDFLELAARLPKLKVLSLAFNDNVDDEVLMAFIDNHRTLESLSVGYCRITGRGVRDIHRLTNLKNLDLSLAVFQDADLSSLRGMPLETLTFMDTDLTGKGVESLKNCKQLKHVQIICNGTATPTFEKSVWKLRKSLPNCRIVYPSNSIE